MTDEDLVIQIYSGDETSFSELYARYQGSIYRFAYHMTGSTSAAEDVVQEAFMTLLQSQTYSSSRAPFASYFFGVARHHVLRWIKHNKIHLPLSASEEDVNSGSHPETDRQETIERLRNAIIALPLRYRETVILCDLQQKSYEEAAQLLDCAIGTIRSRLHRARQLLGKKLLRTRRAVRAKGEPCEYPAL